MGEFLVSLVLAILVTLICYFGLQILLIWSIVIGLVVGFGGFLILDNSEDIFR